MNCYVCCSVVLSIMAGVLMASSVLAGDDLATTSAPVHLSLGPNLFIDDYLIAKSQGLKRTTHQPVKLPEPVLRRAESWHLQPQWFLEVIPDPVTGKFRAWYNSKNPGGNPYICNCYAESDDGIHWTRPELGLVDVGGSKKNSIIDAPLGHFGLFFVDEGPDFADKSRRYKLGYYDEGLGIAFSPDGFHFTPLADNPVIPASANGLTYDQPGYVNGIGDIIEGCWDPIRKEYLLGCKVERTGFPGKPHYHLDGWRRCVGITHSKDFVNWPIPKTVFTPDPANGLEEFYGMKPMVRGNLYIGFLRILRDDLPADEGGAIEGIGWTELATSRDGRKWTRYQEKFIDRNHKPGTWDHAMGWFADCVTVGDREFVYYGGYSAGHKVGNREVGLAFLRKNGFVSRDAGSKTGLLKTSAAHLTGTAMTVNANVRGVIRVRIVDAKGRAIKGFGWDDCLPVKGDSIRHEVRWRGGSLPKLQPVSLEFSVRNGELYGFDLE